MAGYSAHVDTFARDNLPPRDAWPEFVFDLPELRYPERLNAAGALLDDMAAGEAGSRPCIHTDEGCGVIGISWRRPTASRECWSKTWGWCRAIGCSCVRPTRLC